MKHYSANVKKGEEIIEFHIQELAQEGITYVAPFQEPVTPRDKAKNGVINGGGDRANGNGLLEDADKLVLGRAEANNGFTNFSLDSPS